MKRCDAMMYGEDLLDSQLDQVQEIYRLSEQRGQKFYLFVLHMGSIVLDDPIAEVVVEYTTMLPPGRSIRHEREYPVDAHPVETRKTH